MKGFNQVYSRVLKYGSLRVWLATTVYHNLLLHQIDVATVYLHCQLDETTNEMIFRRIQSMSCHKIDVRVKTKWKSLEQKTQHSFAVNECYPMSSKSMCLLWEFILQSNDNSSFMLMIVWFYPMIGNSGKKRWINWK